MIWFLWLTIGFVLGFITMLFALACYIYSLEEEERNNEACEVCKKWEYHKHYPKNFKYCDRKRKGKD